MVLNLPVAGYARLDNMNIALQQAAFVVMGQVLQLNPALLITGNKAFSLALIGFKHRGVRPPAFGHKVRNIGFQRARQPVQHCQRRRGHVIFQLGEQTLRIANL